MSDSSSNFIFKNDTLKTMMQKFSEEAKKQFSTSNQLKAKEMFDFQEYICPQLIPEKKSNSTLINDNYNENFTNEYFKERYKNFIPQNLITPPEFDAPKVKIKKGDILLSKQHTQKDPEEYLQSMKENSRMKDINSKFNLVNWMKLLMNISQPKCEIRELSFAYIERFFSEYCFKALSKEYFACEVVEIILMDNLMILTVKDFSSAVKKVLAVKDEKMQKISELVDDTFCKVGEVVLISRKNSKVIPGFDDDEVLIAGINDIRKI